MHFKRERERKVEREGGRESEIGKKYSKYVYYMYIVKYGDFFRERDRERERKERQTQRDS